MILVGCMSKSPDLLSITEENKHRKNLVTTPEGY